MELVSQELLWLWRGNSSETQEGGRAPLVAGTRRLVKEGRLGELDAC
jgi:hypothetical protein